MHWPISTQRRRYRAHYIGIGEHADLHGINAEKTASEWQDSKAGGLFASLPRLGWMAERTISAQEGDALVEQTRVLSERVATLSSPFMVARYERRERSECATGNVWREHSRGFIVPDEWPARAADFAT